MHRKKNVQNGSPPVKKNNCKKILNDQGENV